jgi:ATP-dependent RNA helicase DeaD
MLGCMTTVTAKEFDQLGLGEPLMKALAEVGYESPSPIQAQIIPLMKERKDVLGQAQTGTGKTAAFALPLLDQLDANATAPQVLVLTPTRELAIQVAEAFQKYGKFVKGFHVLPIYGGQDFRPQIRALKRVPQVVVGTPGRVMDHMRRGTLKLDQLTTLVLDEADEMLRMGFIDDVEWILEQTPPTRQIALFSATMPPRIQRIAEKYLNDPTIVQIQVKTAAADTIRQRFWPVSHAHKLDVLTRILEAEPFDAMIVFVRTKHATVELAERLEARGFQTSPLNGDMPQPQRERTVKRLKAGQLDILVATDVAARGLDVERVSHVVNFDIPYDTEAYIHRIGRTGRAGREGDAILFVTPRERRMLKAIERATRKPIEMFEMPSTETINDKRIANFKQRITDELAKDNLGMFPKLIESYQRKHDVPAVEIAAALANLLQGDTPLLLQGETPGPAGGKGQGKEYKKQDPLPPGMERFQIAVGHMHGVQPGNIVGAIANEAGLENQHIGRVNIYNEYSLVDLPEGMPPEVFQLLKRVMVCGCKLRISRIDVRHDDSKKRSHSPRQRERFQSGARRGGPQGGNRGSKPGGRKKRFKP